MTARPASNKFDPAGNLLAGCDRHGYHMPVLNTGAFTLVERELTGYSVPVILNERPYSGPSSFLVRLRQKDDVARQRHTEPFEFEEDFQV